MRLGLKLARTTNPVRRAALPELDSAAALARLGGNRQMYRRLLGRFQENQRDVIERLQHAREQGDSATLILASHTLRGLAGNIGADRLATLAGQLEDRLKADQEANPKPEQTANAADIAGMINQLASVLQPILTMTLDADNAAPRSPHAEPDEATRRDAISQLRQLLDNDDATATRYFDEISGWLTELAEPALAEQLARQIGHYEFEEACLTLQQLSRLLNP